MRSIWLLPLLLGACVSAGGPVETRSRIMPPVQVDGPSLVVDGKAPLGLHWTRTSAEHRAILIQTYHGASAQLREIAAPLERGSWAVIMDADETVLDNSPYFLRQAERGHLAFGYYTWREYMNEAISPALPGASEFTRLVRELGGRVVIVTNRAEDMCDNTRRNLAKASIPADAVLCRAPGVEDKNPRFVAVEKGEVAGLPPLRVVMYVGDNIQDFPGLFQAQARSATDAAYGEFGRSWWIMPNPLYGSWQSNPLPSATRGRR